MLGTIGHPGPGLSLRQICQRYDGKEYHDEYVAGRIAAAVFNAQGGIGGEASSPKDFVGAHALDETEQVDAHTAHMMAHAGVAAAYGLVDV